GCRRDKRRPTITTTPKDREDPHDYHQSHTLRQATPQTIVWGCAPELGGLRRSVWTCHQLLLRPLSLDEEGEQRGQLPNVERGRGDLAIRDRVKNPQPWGRGFRVGDRQIYLIAAIDGQVRHKNTER